MVSRVSDGDAWGGWRGNNGFEVRIKEGSKKNRMDGKDGKLRSGKPGVQVTEGMKVLYEPRASV